MIKKYHLTVISAILYCGLIPVYAQLKSIDSLFNEHKPVSIEKLYLQTDRDFYALGDTIWYKTYSVDGLTNKPFSEEHNLTVELISDSGLNISNNKHILIEGWAGGDFTIPDSISPGSYFIRASTPILERIGEKTFFHKKIKIERIMNSYEQQALYGSVPDKEIMGDISFLPEGGRMIYNVMNTIAVKAVSTTGKGIHVSGMVIDEEGNTVADFKTIYRGLGWFGFIPLQGHKYRISMNEYPEFNHQFNDIKPDGVLLRVENKDSAQIILSFLQNPENRSVGKYYLTAMHRDEFIFYVQVDLNTDSRLLRLDKSLFPPGISKLTLMNQNFEPVAERLVFLNHMKARNIVSMQMDKASYCSREKALLAIKTGIHRADSAYAGMSISIVNSGYISTEGFSQNMLSYLLIDSELKGIIESPPSFFLNDSLIKAEEKLDLLMLTQGWRAYIWDDFDSIQPDYRNIHDLSGISIRGNVERLVGKKPVKGGQVFLVIYDKDISIIDLRTDRNGRFDSGPLFISDSTYVFVQAKNEKDKKYTEIFLDSIIIAKRTEVDFMKQNTAELSIPLKFFRYNYYRRNAEMEYFQKTGILLDPVTIIAKKPERSNEIRIYSVADNTLKIREQDYSYPDVLSYLQGRVPGVNVEGDNITIRGYSTFSSGGGALILIDGIPYGNGENAIERLKSIPMSEIDRIDVLKNIVNLSIFGSRGAGGAIAVYTKRGEIGVRDPYIPGIISKRLRGYYKMRKFYSPVYDEQNLSQEIPDYRPTLYWDPSVEIDDDGNSQLEFFTSDELSDYLVILEGITNDGRIIFETTSFIVDARNPGIKKNLP